MATTRQSPGRSPSAHEPSVHKPRWHIAYSFGPITAALFLLSWEGMWRSARHDVVDG